MPCAAPTHAGSAPAALRSARHPCSLPTTQHCPSLPRTQILPHHGIACYLHPLSRGKTTQGRFWGSRSGHPLQHPVPAGDIPAHGSTVWGIDLSLPCPLRIRSKIAYTWLWVIPRSCLPRLGPLPCGLALGTCIAEIGALQRLSGLADRSQHLLCLWKDSCGADTECFISHIPLLQYCHIFLLQGNVHDL